MENVPYASPHVRRLSEEAVTALEKDLGHKVFYVLAVTMERSETSKILLAYPSRDVSAESFRQEADFPHELYFPHNLRKVLAAKTDDEPRIKLEQPAPIARLRCIWNPVCEWVTLPAQDGVPACQHWVCNPPQ